MITKVINQADDISSELDNTFLYCKETGEGILKFDLSGLTLSDSNFRTVIDTLNSLNYTDLIASGLNSILFQNGEIYVSKLVEEKLKNQISLLEDDLEKANLINSRRLVRRYFREDSLVIVHGGATSESGQLIL